MRTVFRCSIAPPQAITIDGDPRLACGGTSERNAPAWRSAHRSTRKRSCNIIFNVPRQATHRRQVCLESINFIDRAGLRWGDASEASGPRRNELQLARGHGIAPCITAKRHWRRLVADDLCIVNSNRDAARLSRSSVRSAWARASSF